MNKLLIIVDVRQGFLLCCIGLFVVISGCKPSPSGVITFDYSQTNQKSEGTKGTVVTAHPLASQIGIDILEKGGNAIDATIATHFALAVTCPRAGNIGGGGFMVVRMADGRLDALDFRERAPQQASKDMYLDAEGNAIESLSKDGHLAVGVPGTVAGMIEAHRKYGVLPFPDLVQPAVEIAKRGFTISKSEQQRINKYQQSFQSFNSKEDCPFVKETLWKTGDVLKQEDLAATLSRIAEKGREGFYSGITAELLVKEMMEGEGLITKEDLQNYKPIWRKPVETSYKEVEIISMPLPSSGGIILSQIFTMMEYLEIGNYGSPEYIHTLAEIEKRAYADRADYMGDSDFVKVPIKELTDTQYLKKKVIDFDMEKATKFDHILNGVKSKTLESYETTHTSIIDVEGNAVSTTNTLNGNYGSKVIVGGAGFFLNNEMDDFSVKPGVPNLYGLVGSEANAIEANKRMLSSMTPTIVTKKGKVFMILGTPGGSTIITSVLQMILNVIEHGMTLNEAQAQPRFHHQFFPDRILMEEGKFSVETIEALKNKGHKIEFAKTIGKVKAVMIKDGVQYGVGDPRNQDDCALSQN